MGSQDDIVLYKALIENMEDGYIRIIPASNRQINDFSILETNKCFDNMINAVGGETENKRFSEYAADSAAGECFAEILGHLEAGERTTKWEYYSPHNCCWYRASLFVNPDATVTVLFHDITEEKKNDECRHLFTISKDMHCIIDVNGKLIRYNPAWEEAFESVSGDFWSLIHPEDIAASRETFKQMIKGEAIIRFENRYLSKNKQYLWLQWNAYPIPDSGLYYAVARDITKKKTIEQQLKESEEKWQFALEGSNSGVWDWNVQTNVQTFSKTWKNMLGYEEHEISDGINEWISRIHPEDFEEVMRLMDEYLLGKNEIYDIKHRLLCKDGQYKWILSKGKIIKWDERGKPIRIIGTHTDITELKNALEELKKLSKDYETVFNGTQDALFLVSVDEDGLLRYIRLNQAHERLSGITTAQVKGRTPREVLGEEFGAVIENNYYHCIEKRSVIEYQEECELPAGRRTWNTVLSPVIRDNKVVYLVGSSRDISEEKEMEASNKKAEERIHILNESIAYENLKTEFFSNLSHELRTPLNVILCAMQLMDLTVKNSTDLTMKNNMSRYVGIMKQNCYRLLRLVNNLIDITKIDSGYFNIMLQNYDIVGLVKDIAMSVEMYVENKDIALSFQTDMEERIMAIDADKLERILLNLLSNAVKFTNSKGEIKVSLWEKGDKIFISVKDSGIGIPQDKLDVIFKRFSQVDRSMTRSHEGSGIGLALVKSMVVLHGGDIAVQSKLGEGSEFIIELPVKLVFDEENKLQQQAIMQQDHVERINIEFSDIYSD